MELYWIDERLAVGPRPGTSSSLDAALDAARDAGVDVLVSCLTDGEERALGLLDEERLARERGIRFEWLRITDIEAPSDALAFDRMIHRLVAERAAGRRVAIHCKMGMGRAPLTAASVLVAEGRTAVDAWTLIRARRGRTVPDNEVQEAWVSDYEARNRA